MNKRILSADELARLLKSSAHEPDFAVSLGENFRAVQMAEHSGLTFTLERNGQAHELKDASPAELKEISDILWTRFEPFISTPDDDLTPPELMDAEPDTAQGLDALVPDYLRPKPDNPNLEADPLGLTPDNLRARMDDHEPGQVFCGRTAAEKADALLTPGNYQDKSE